MVKDVEDVLDEILDEDMVGAHEEPLKELDTVTCPKCGTVSFKGTKKCVKCHTLLDNDKKSCPRCAKRNDITAEKCISCGYSFKKKKHSITLNVIISVLLVLALFLLVSLEYTGVVKKINLIIKILSGIFIIFLLYSNVNYGYKDIIKYHEKENPNDKIMKAKLARMKRISNILIISAGIVIFICLIIYYFSGR